MYKLCIYKENECVSNSLNVYGELIFLTYNAI